MVITKKSRIIWSTVKVSWVRRCSHNVCRMYSKGMTALIKSNRKAMNRNWSNQKANPALKTKAGNK